jgi:hypothetical protein
MQLVPLRFGEHWERLKAQHRGEITAEVQAEVLSRGAQEAEELLDEAVDQDVFEAFGGLHRRSGASRKEPHDDYYFDKFVVNETEDDSDVIDLVGLYCIQLPIHSLEAPG